jgi:hypothetical protein
MGLQIKKKLGNVINSCRGDIGYFYFCTVAALYDGKIKAQYLAHNLIVEGRPVTILKEKLIEKVFLKFIFTGMKQQKGINFIFINDPVKITEQWYVIGQEPGDGFFYSGPFNQYVQNDRIGKGTDGMVNALRNYQEIFFSHKDIVGLYLPQ